MQAAATHREPRRATALVAATLALSLALAGCGAFKGETEQDRMARQSNDQLYAEARSEMDAGGWERAIRALERLQARTTGTLMGQQAMLDLAYAQWRSGERALALAQVDRFIKLHPSSPAFDYALYLRGIINFNDNLGLFGRWSNQSLAERDQRASREAYQSFEQLIQQFPNSKYAADARQRMNFIVNSLAENEIAVARYYFRRGAWLAAANRAQQSLGEFQGTPTNAEALQIMIRSYDRLGLAQLRDDAQRVYDANFGPGQTVSGAAAVAPAAERPWWKFWN